MEYIARLLEFIQKIFVWWVIIVPWEQGVRIRGGKKVKVLNQGCHLRIPFWDQIFSQATRQKTIQMPPQTISTKDGKTLAVVCCVAYSIINIEELYQTLCQPEMTLSGIVMSHMAEFVANNNIADCIPSVIEKKVFGELSKNQWGIHFEYVRITNFAMVRTYRLIQDGHWMPDRLDTSRVTK